MLNIEKPIEGNFPEINHTANSFKEALKLKVPRVRVKNPEGEDYDLVTYKNDDLFVLKPTYVEEDLFPDYDDYDISDTGFIWLGYLSGLERLLVEELDEYSKAIIDVVLEHTDMDVYIKDNKAEWFYEPNERIKIVEELPEYNKEKDLYLVSNFNFLIGIEYGDFHKVSSVPAFNNLFFKKWLLGDKDLSKVKYIDKHISDDQGIGGMISILNKQKPIFENLGFKLISNSDMIGRYHRDFFENNFNFDLSVPDSNEENTIFIEHEGPISLVPYFMQRIPLDKSVFNEELIQSMDDYYNKVFGDQKVLGVIMRGTDYVIHFKNSTHKRSATVEEMIPIIREKFENGNYDRIFLATEDKDILDRMRSEFGEKVTAIAQKRYKEKHFRGGKTILDVEKMKAEGTELDRLEEDTTINYLYALYLLSKCAGLISSSQSNGFDVVIGLNNGNFEEIYKYNPVKEKPKEEIDLKEAFKLPERLDIYNMDEIYETIKEEFKDKDQIVLEGSNLTYLSSAALWIFEKLVKELNKDIIIANADNYIRDSFYLTGYDDLVRFID